MGPFGQGPLDVWQFAIVGFLVAAKGERLDSAGVLYQLLRLRMANLSFGRIASESPAPIAILVRIGCRFGPQMPLKVGKSGVIIRTVSRIIFGLGCRRSP